MTCDDTGHLELSRIVLTCNDGMIKIFRFSGIKFFALI